MKLAEKLNRHQEQHLVRQRKVLGSAQGVNVMVDGVAAINFSSNDYLGLANHPVIKKAAIAAINKYGVGGGASQMICGYHQLQQTFEKHIAEFLGFEAALVFSSGYLANLGVLTSLPLRHAMMFTDRENHASLIDGAQASFANVCRYQHNHMLDLEEKLIASHASRRVILTEGVFSMDGSMADLPKLGMLAAQHQAHLIIDDAHGIGTMGPEGRGSIAYHRFDPKLITCLMGTLGKAFGGSGAFVCGSRETIDYILQFARSAIYTTAIPPLLMASSLAALELIKTQTHIHKRLHDLILYFTQAAKHMGITLLPSVSPIQSIVIGDNQRVLQIQKSLLAHGFWVSAIRPPTVPVHTARLRISLTAAHEPEQIDALLQALTRILAE